MIIPATVLISGAIVIMVFVKRRSTQQKTDKRLHDLSEMAGLHSATTTIGIVVAIVFLSADIDNDFMLLLGFFSYIIMGLALMGLARLAYKLSNV